MEIPISLPLDNGFLRRECPSCERQFKWHHGPTASAPPDAPSPAEYTCPYCGSTAPTDEWHTAEQAEYIREAATGPALQTVSDAMADAFRGSKHITYKPGRVEHHHPIDLDEPADMVIVESPCHPYEPVKVDESWDRPLHCLLCGAQFTLS